MPDVGDKETRSRMMSGIRGKNTRPEILLRIALHHRGFRYRLHARNVTGHPDLVLPKHHSAIFVHGCYWHRHTDCKYATTPSSNVDFWIAKFTANVERDRRVIEQLFDQNWRVAVVWECAIRKEPIDSIADRVATWLISDEPSLEIPPPLVNLPASEPAPDRRIAESSAQP